MFVGSHLAFTRFCFVDFCSIRGRLRPDRPTSSAPPDLPVELCQPIIELAFFLNQPFSGDAALLQGGHSVHVLGKPVSML